MLAFLSRLFSKFQASEPDMGEFEFDQVGLWRSYADGKIEQIKWRDVKAILVMVTSAGPFLGDVFWLVVGYQGGCVVPFELDVERKLFHHIEALPGFDHSVFLRAMDSTRDENFLVWQSPDAEITGGVETAVTAAHLAQLVSPAGS